jgi:hypothetical protein
MNPHRESLTGDFSSYLPIVILLARKSHRHLFPAFAFHHLRSQFAMTVTAAGR